MPAEDRDPTPTRVLIKMRPSSALRAAGARANLRPLFDGAEREAAAFGVGGEPQWFLADLPEGGDTAWDLAHTRVADQLGVASSDIEFVEPDLTHDIYLDPDDPEPTGRLRLGATCTADPQSTQGGAPVGPSDEGWHLAEDFSGLERARDAVAFSDRRTRIAQLDTGYDRGHATVPARVLRHMERSFVDGDADPQSAEDPDRDGLIPDNSGHGTGTLSVLAGGAVPAWNGRVMGGAPEADVVPLRIADRVVLLKTSAFAKALEYARVIGADVVTMSMGGLPSRAWRETVDEAYEAGVFVVTAAGNNFAGLPTKKLVYPARYGRVVAACGAMADLRPYHLTGKTMQGNYGPRSKMGTAMSAFTPNIPWARFGCAEAVRLNGGGTSSATPQIAAAAALWMEKYKNVLPRDWRRVEAARNALFSSARDMGDEERFGHGLLRAHRALGVRPVLGLSKTKSDRDWFALLRVLTGLGVMSQPPREQMFNLELMQLWLVSDELRELVPDPDADDAAEKVDVKTLIRIMDAVIADERASRALRRHLTDRYTSVAGRGPARRPENADVVPESQPACESTPELTEPRRRRLRVYAGDPSLSESVATAATSEVTLNVRWEPLGPGPVGEYLDVDDADPAGDGPDRVNLDDPRLLARDGWAPSAGNAQFHQQMVYAVAMTTIEHFERALGRPVLWRALPKRGKPHDDSRFVRRLRVQPHALRAPNAYYSPGRVALEFGYFDAAPAGPERLVPGSRVYTCLSHDIVAHETTHAVLDGMARRFNEPTNPDVLAFHEAFADIVALFQRFTLRDVLEREVARTRGDLAAESTLGSLAIQFGHAIGSRGALREAIGHMENGDWVRNEPDPTALGRTRSPHQRGAILVAAVFDAFLSIYRGRSADLLRIYTGGTGVLPDGAIHPDLVRRLADEACKAALHVLNMCIRALDYLPPVDVTFFEYLRALITADYDLVPDDPRGYRVAFVEAFRRRGIFPERIGSTEEGVSRTLSVETLRWWGLGRLPIPKSHRAKVRRGFDRIVDELRAYADACTYFETREDLFHATRERRIALHGAFKALLTDVPELGGPLGVDPSRPVEVHELRRAMRSSPDRATRPQVIVSLTQARRVRSQRKSKTPGFQFRGGSTLVIDLAKPAVEYSILKRVGSERRETRTASYLRALHADPLQAFYFSSEGGEPFAGLHGLGEG